MKTYPPGYFTEPIYNPTTWPPGFVPTLFENWGHKSAQASMAASENRERRVASGCSYALGSIDMPGTPNTPPPKPTVRKKGAVSGEIARMSRRAQGLTTMQLGLQLGISQKEAGQRVAFYNREQVRMKLPRLVMVPTGHRRERRYFDSEERAGAYLQANPVPPKPKRVRNRK